LLALHHILIFDGLNNVELGFIRPYNRLKC